MRRENRHVAGLRVGVVERNVLLHGQVQCVVHARGGSGIFANVLAGHRMLDDMEGRCHD
jgi:hypothetical protein